MKTMKRRLEQGIEDFTGTLIRFRWGVLVLMIVLTVGAVRQLPHLTIDMSDEGFLHENDPILLEYNKFRDQFGRDDMVVLAIKSEHVFSLKFLEKLRSLHKDLENNVPHLDDITSLYNARNTRGVEDGIIVEDLLEKWPQNQDNLEQIRDIVMSNPLYRDRLISEDGRFTTIILKTDAYGNVVTEEDALEMFDSQEDEFAENQEEKRTYITEEQRGAIVMAATKIAAKYQEDDFVISLAGSPVVTSTVKKTMRSDMMLFLRLAVVVIGVFLFCMFRRVSAVVYPLLVVILSLISTLAMMSLLGIAIKMPTMILPSFILAVGVGDSVHVLSMFFQKFQQLKDKEKALKAAMGHSGLAIIMTSLTTAAGLASFSGADIAPVADLGIFSSMGVLLALLYTIILLPVLISLTPLRTKKLSDQEVGLAESNSIMGKLMDFFTDFSTRNNKAVLVFFLALIIGSGVGISRLHFSHNVLSWLPVTMPVLKATDTIDQNLRGSVTMELVLDTGRENGLYDPAVLNNIEKLSRELEVGGNFSIAVGKVMSVVDVLKEIHRSLNENKDEFYAIPQEPKLIPQEFLLFENSGSDDLEDVVDSRFQLARITIKVPWQDALYYVPFIEEVESRGQEIFGSKVTLTTTGVMTLFGRIIHSAIYSATQSYLIAFAVITLMMIFMVGSVRLGLAAMLPNLAPIIITMGLMGWLGLPLDMFTMLIGSIAIGIAVDDTIHFIYNFRRYFAQSGDGVTAVRQTLHTAGRAMMTTTVVLSLGFFIFMFASMNNLFNFGMLTGIALILALLSDFLLAPALFTLISSSRVGRSEIIKH